MYQWRNSVMAVHTNLYTSKHETVNPLITTTRVYREEEIEAELGNYIYVSNNENYDYMMQIGHSKILDNKSSTL